MTPPGNTDVLVQRIWAHAIDTVAPFACMLVVAVLLPPEEALPLLTPFIIGSALFNWLVAQGVSGYTLGKYALGIRAVDAAGRPPGLLRALKRFLPLVVEWLGIFGLWAMTTHPHHQRFGDRWAGTYVIAARGSRAPSRASSPAP